MRWSSILLTAALTAQYTTCFVPQTRTPAFRRIQNPTTARYSDAGVNGDAATATATKEEEKQPEEKVPLTLTTKGSFSIDTTHRAPNTPGPAHTITFDSIPGQSTDVPSMVIETGKIGRQAAGAVTLTRGDTVLYATASRDDKPRDGLDFLPLSVEHQERFSSAGMTSGSYNKRDGRPAEHEILTCRLIDRPLRPLIANGWRHETQLLNWVLSYDKIWSCDPLAIIASATALYLSDVPLTKPVAAVEVGYIDGQLLINPTNEQMDESRLHLTVAGTKDGILMIEGAADFLPEDVMINAVQFGHEAIKSICEGIEAYGETVGITKNFDTIKPPVEGLQERVDELMTERVDVMFNMPAGRKEENGKVMGELKVAVIEELEDEFPSEDYRSDINAAFKDLLSRRMFVLGHEKQLRCDGRQLNEIRTLDMEAGFLPRVHGSALFTRGETQTIATATLGDSGMRQKIDTIDGQESKRFYLQYTFPPSCVGETGRVGAPGRREVGHGNLAERALLPTLPDDASFPYTIRVESLITESHGSSSMASVCGGSLALMDAGVPVKSPVAGIAMGMLLGNKDAVSDESAVILSDISGTEDALGTMDFKVAGDKEGITTFQLDIKCEGLSVATMERALAQAKEGRLHILEAMDKVLAAARDDLPSTVPKLQTFEVPYESIGKVIGPGGKQIRAIIEDFKLENMDVNDNGRIQISGYDREKLDEAESFVMKLIVSSPRGGRGGGGGRDKENGPKYAGPEPVKGQIYQGKITGIHNFGVFVEILPGAEDGSTPGFEGLCHVSELARERVRNCEGFVKAMNTDVLEVMYMGINDKGKATLSRKAILEERYGGGNPQGGDKSGKASPPAAKMSKDEGDVIAKAIEDL